MKIYSEPIYSKVLASRIETNLKASNPQFATMFRFMIETGIGLQNTISFVVSDARSKRMIHVEPESKRAIGYIAPISDILIDMLNIQCASRSDDEFLFFSKNGYTPVSRSSFTKALHKAIMAVAPDKEEALSVGSLRKTYFYHLYQRTNDIRIIMKYTGHPSIKRVQEYLGVETVSLTPSDIIMSSRERLLTNNNGIHLIDNIIDALTEISEGLYNPLNPDFYYDALEINLSNMKDFLDSLLKR